MAVILGNVEQYLRASSPRPAPVSSSGGSASTPAKTSVRATRSTTGRRQLAGLGGYPKKAASAWRMWKRVSFRQAPFAAQVYLHACLRIAKQPSSRGHLESARANCGHESVPPPHV